MKRILRLIILTGLFSMLMGVSAFATVSENYVFVGEGRGIVTEGAKINLSKVCDSSVSGWELPSTGYYDNVWWDCSDFTALSRVTGQGSFQPEKGDGLTAEDLDDYIEFEFYNNKNEYQLANVLVMPGPYAEDYDDDDESGSLEVYIPLYMGVDNKEYLVNGFHIDVYKGTTKLGSGKSIKISDSSVSSAESDRKIIMSFNVGRSTLEDLISDTMKDYKSKLSKEKEELTLRVHPATREASGSGYKYTWQSNVYDDASCYVYKVKLGGTNVSEGYTYGLAGQKVVVTATANSGYKFSNGSSTASSSVTVKASTTSNSYSTSASSSSTSKTSSTSSGSGGTGSGGNYSTGGSDPNTAHIITPLGDGTTGPDAASVTSGTSGSGEGTNAEDGTGYDAVPKTGEGNERTIIALVILLALFGAGYSVYLGFLPGPSANNEEEQ